MLADGIRAEVTYLSHSGFAVKTARHFLIFDYYRDSPKGGVLRDGVIDPRSLARERVAVFVSHGHHDHYNPVIFDWKREIPDIAYVLSDDIPAREPGVHLVSPGKEYELEDLFVRTLASTDEGVAFLVKVDDLTLYHAGDLNWWHWNDEPDEDNRRMAARYQAQIDSLRGQRIDLAFIPVDPRQEENSLLGLDYLMRTVGAQRVFPMHFWEQTQVFDRLREDPRTEAYRGSIVELGRRGEQYLY